MIGPVILVQVKVVPHTASSYAFIDVTQINGITAKRLLKIVGTNALKGLTQGA
jgi:hypothetical protein